MSRLTKLIRQYFPRAPKLSLGKEDDLMLRGALDGQPRNGVFLDLGANVGNVTAVALEYGHKVYAFEPDPQARRTLLSRFEGNPKVEIIAKAIGGSARTSQFYTCPGTDTHSSSLWRQGGHSGGGVYDVEVVDIVEFVRSLPLVTIVKMDIEGAEVECLVALLDAGLLKDIPLVLVETHERFSEELATGIAKIRERVEGMPNVNLEWG